MMTKCAECGADLSTQALACPRCAAPTPKARAKAPTWLIVILLLGFASCAYCVVSGPSFQRGFRDGIERHR